MAVVSAFGCPFENFAFDDAGVRASSSARVETAGEPVDRPPPDHVGVVRLLRGKKSPVRRSGGRRGAL